MDIPTSAIAITKKTAIVDKLPVSIDPTVTYITDKPQPYSVLHVANKVPLTISDKVGLSFISTLQEDGSCVFRILPRDGSVIPLDVFSVKESE